MGFSYSKNYYRVVVEQMRIMINILGFKDVVTYYFYEPDRFKDFINSKGMNYDEIELSFRELCAKDRKVYNIGNGLKLDSNENYKVHRYLKIIFDNFSKAIGEINTLEEFEKKYTFFQTYTDGMNFCLCTMLIAYYRSIGEDINELLSKKIKINTIKDVLNRLNIRFDVFKCFYGVPKLFVQDKNQTAINLYEFYMKDPSLYFSIFAQNYAYIFEHFRKMDAVPDKELYDALRYPIIGALLKDQREFDFSDVSHCKFEELKSKMHIYLFYTSDSQLYGYTAKGEKIKKLKIWNNVFEIKMTEHCICKLIQYKDDRIDYTITATEGFDIEEYVKNVKFEISHYYSEKSDIEYWIQESQENKKIDLKWF